MSVSLYLEENGEHVFETNFTYNYSGMWALAIGQAGKEHDPPKSFLYPKPKDAVKMIEIEGMTGKESMKILHHAIEAMVIDMNTYRALNPSNGWGNADLFLERLKQCVVAAGEHPEAVWSAFR